MSAVPAPDRSPLPAGESVEPRHARAAAAFLSALLAGTGAEGDDAWSDAAAAWEAQLTRGERVAVLGRAIAACAAEDAIELMEAALGDMTGPPGVPFTTMTEEAANWVAVATLAEIKIYLLACFKALPKSDRVAFLGAAQRVVLK